MLYPLLARMKNPSLSQGVVFVTSAYQQGMAKCIDLYTGAYYFDTFERLDILSGDEVVIIRSTLDNYPPSHKSPYTAFDHMGNLFLIPEGIYAPSYCISPSPDDSFTYGSKAYLTSGRAIFPPSGFEFALKQKHLRHE